VASAAALLLGACGGGDDDGDDGGSEPASASADDEEGADAGGDDDGNDDDANDDDDRAGGSDASSASTGPGVVLGTPTITAEPGKAWAEVGADRFDYASAGSVGFECLLAADRVTVNFQTPEGRNLLIQGSSQTGDWHLSATFASGEDDNTQYGAESSSGDGVFTVGDGLLSYEGTINKVVDRDIVNPEEVDGQIAVNCASPGGDPTAEVGGVTYTFPIPGAQSFDCVVSDDEIDVMINRLAMEDLQLQISGRVEGDQLIGGVYIIDGEERLSSTFPADRTGLTLDGSTLTYEGTFTAADGTESPGSVEITC
jgi:hypothetical protein